MMPGYPGMYAPPPPGFFGTTAAGMGMGTSGHQQMMAQQSGAALFGGGAVSAMSAVPTAVGTGVGIAGMFAPMAIAGLTPGAGTGMLGRGAMAMGRGAFRAADVLDPTTHLLPMMGSGYRGGYGVGSRMFGVGRGIAAARAAGMSGGVMSAISHAGASRGVMAGIGMAGRVGAAGAMGVGGALGAAALPIGASIAAFEGLRYTGEQFYQGASDTMQGQALMNQLGPGIAPGQSMQGQGAATGRMMRDLATDMGVGTEDIGRYAKQLNSQKVFQTTRSAKEFRTKFKEVMKAVKEIADVTKGTVDDAMQMFSDMRQQGFYTTADMKAEAASRSAREMTTGISAGVFSAVGGAGSQMARQYGMRGRYGSQLAQRNVAGVAAGVRSGAISEEEVMEMGGAEAVGLRMSQRQMGFLGTSRGRAMIAYAMGEGGAPDMDRLGKLMRGTSMEDIVTGAAGRGLGVLQQAGMRESKEAFMPYAGMAMVQMASAQQKQLYGGTSKQGILNMMGTMGIGRQEAEIMLQQTMQMPEQMRREQLAKEQAATEAQYKRLQDDTFMRRMGTALDRNVGRGLRRMGSQAYSSLARQYQTHMENLTGGEVYKGGDDALARRGLAEGGLSGALTRSGVEEGGGLLGISSSSRRLQQQFRGMTFTGEDMDPAELQRQLDSGEIVDLGIGGRERAKQGFMGAVDLMTGGIMGQTIGRGGTTAQGRRYIRRSDVEKGTRAYAEGQEEGATAEGGARLGLALGRGDFMSQLHASRRNALGGVSAGGYLGGAGGGGFQEGAVGFLSSLAMDIGIGGATLSDLDLSGSMSETQRMHDIYYTAKRGQIIGDMSFREFMAKDQDEKLKIQGQVTSELRKRAAAGSETAQTMIERIGEVETGLLETRDIQVARDQFKSIFDKALTDEFGGFGSSIFGGKQSKLTQWLTTDGAARASYDGYMRELLKGKDNYDPVALEAYEAELREKFGEDSPEFRALQAQRTQLETDPESFKRFKEAYEGPGGLGKVMTDRAQLEKYHRDAEGLKRRVSGVNKEGMDPALKSAVSKLGLSLEKGDLEGRRAAMGDLITGVIGGEGGITAEERELLNRIGGAGQGEKISSFVSALEGGTVSDKDKKMLAAEGIDEDRLRKIAELEGEEQAKAIKKVFEEAGLLDLAMFQSDEGATSMRGVQQQYVETNADFVRAVHAFVSALGSVKGIKGLPVIPGPDAFDQGGGAGGADIPGSGNTGGD
jgi:hypothetical protein